MTTSNALTNGAAKGWAGVARVVVALPVTAWGLERLIDMHPHEMCCVGSAPSAAQAVMWLGDWQPDVVLFDLDGTEGTDPLALFQAQTTAPVLAVTSSSDALVHDAAILAGARGVLGKREAPETVLKALVKVAAGEMWIDRHATGRIFMELARQRVQTLRDDPAKAKLALLTPRERQTLLALAADAASPGKVLADRLHISENTLRNHLTSIYSKLGVSNRTELYAFAHQHGVVSAG